MSNDPLKKIVIDHRSKITVGEQLKNQIEVLIQNNEIIALDALPSAKDLAKELSIKQKEVESAYQLLEKKEYIVYKKDNLPIVKHFDRIIDFFTNFMTIEDAIIKMGLVPHVKIISLKIETSKLPKSLDQKQLNESFMVIKRLYYANDVPIIFMEDLYPTRLYPNIENKKYRNVKSFYKDILIKQYNVKISKTKRILSVVEIPEDISKLLGVQKKQAVFKVDMSYDNQHGEILAYGIGYSIPSYYFETNHHTKT